MATEKITQFKNRNKKFLLDFPFRFADKEHRELVSQAATQEKLSLNAWMVKSTLSAARSQLAEK